jgi:hypothetical protein
VSRLRTAGAVVAVSAALLAAGVFAWIVGGNALAARRERAAEREWEKAFGSHAFLVRKYTVAETNASARRVEELARELGVNLELRTGPIDWKASTFPEAERAARWDYLRAELGRSAGLVMPPPPAVAEALASRRAPLSTFEEFLSSAPTPRWACDPSGHRDDWPHLPLTAHVQLQRLLVADALAFASKGESAAAARALEAAWALNGSAVARPEVTAQIIATAAFRGIAGALRRIDTPPGAWLARLEAMGARVRLAEGLTLERLRPETMRAQFRHGRPPGVGWWAHNVVSLLEEPRERLASADYDQGFCGALVGLRDGPAFREPEREREPGKDSTAVILSIAIPNIRNSFDRADRLALDAELTGKILRLREERRTAGEWPPPSAEISSSRFPGFAWTYRVDGGGMSIALPRELPKVSSGLVLPTSFSSASSKS